MKPDVSPHYEDQSIKGLDKEVAAALNEQAAEATLAVAAALQKMKAVATSEHYTVEYAAAGYWSTLKSLLTHLHG